MSEGYGVWPKGPGSESIRPRVRGLGQVASDLSPSVLTLYRVTNIIDETQRANGCLSDDGSSVS